MSNTELSEFFSLISEEKNENLEKLKNKIKDPESGLANLFEQLESAHKETTRVSEEISVEKILTEEDQNRLDVFSNLMTSFDSVKEIPEEVKVVRDVELKEIEEPEEIIPEEIVKTDNIISDIVNALDEMGEKTEVKEEIDQISALRRDFNNFKNLIQRDIANQKMSGAGSGEVRLEFLDDVERSTAKVDGKFLKYRSSDNKWIGADGGSSAISELDIDGATDIGAALADADLFIVDDGAGGTNRITAASRIKTYVSDVTLTTSAQSNITSVGTLTSLTVDNIVINGTNIGHTSDTDALAIDSSGNVTASQNLTVSGDLTVTGTTKTVDTVTMEAANAVVFEGTTADAYETTLTITDPTADRTITLPNTTGTVALTSSDITGNAATATALETARTIGGTSFDGTANIAVSLAATATALASARTIHGVSFDGTANIDLTEVVQDTVGAMFSSNTETGITVTYQDGDGTVDLVIGTLNQDTTGLAGTATALATARTIGGTSFDGTANIAVALAATATALASARTIHGVSFDGTANIDLSEVISDTVGAMFSSNTETGVTVTYQDSDNTIDVVVGTLNQDTTGNAATATALATARTIGGTSFDGTANIAVALSATATALASARTIGGVSFDGTANINLPGVNTSGSQDTSGTAALATSVTVSANNSTNETVYPIFVDGATGSQGAESDTGLTYNPSSGNLAIGGELAAATLDISGNADIDGTLEADAYTVNGTALNDYIAALAGTTELLEETDGDNVLMDASAAGTDVGDDILLESGVDGGRDLDHSILQSLTSDIIPQQGGKFNLGSPSHRFKNIYLGSQTIDIGGAQISSDGSGSITISADGVTVPVGSKDADGNGLAVQTAAGQTFRSVKLFTQASGLSTHTAIFKFNAAMSNKTVYTEAGHVFTLSNGDARADTGIELFQF